MVGCTKKKITETNSTMMCRKHTSSALIHCNERVPVITYQDKLKLLTRNKTTYYTQKEILVHNKPDDCWVSFLGLVRDLTPLSYEYIGRREMAPIYANAGKNISHWFDERTGDIRQYIHPVTGVRVPFLPHGMIPHVGIHVPSTDWQPLNKEPWWFDPSYVIGMLTKNSRPIRIMNVLTEQENIIEVCCEDSINRIQERYKLFNNHAESYTWAFERKILNMKLNLDENGIPDPRTEFRKWNMRDDTYIPCLMLYYNDDLT